ncbi:hypothetical protein BN2475_940016 [Paraburkholderia ribeironis]|uniref:Uncharacterized protein n=1 Tax=Paraburkholderia ribeironis TaxID=1247936 RepID=A0A1N7SL56_9BURK|nr:hypothetical protein BN2475_940016 [Paraburkholderia ribeironis]
MPVRSVGQENSYCQFRLPVRRLSALQALVITLVEAGGLRSRALSYVAHPRASALR